MHGNAQSKETSSRGSNASAERDGIVTENTKALWLMVFLIVGCGAAALTFVGIHAAGADLVASALAAGGGFALTFGTLMKVWGFLKS